MDTDVIKAKYRLYQLLLESWHNRTISDSEISILRLLELDVHVKRIINGELHV